MFFFFYCYFYIIMNEYSIQNEEDNVELNETDLKYLSEQIDLI